MQLKIYVFRIIYYICKIIHLTRSRNQPKSERQMKNSNNKSEVLEQLNSDVTLGIAYAQSGITCQVMTYREFLDWYRDAGTIRMEIKEIYNDELACNETFLIHHNNSNGRNYREYSRELFENYDLAKDKLYKCLENDFHSDNGAGGNFYENAESIAGIEANEHDYLFE